MAAESLKFGPTEGPRMPGEAQMPPGMPAWHARLLAALASAAEMRRPSRPRAGSRSFLRRNKARRPPPRNSHVAIARVAARAVAVPPRALAESLEALGGAGTGRRRQVVVPPPRRARGRGRRARRRRGSTQERGEHIIEGSVSPGVMLTVSERSSVPRCVAPLSQMK